MVIVGYQVDNFYWYDFLIFCTLFSLFVSIKFYMDIANNFTSRETIFHCLYFDIGKDMGVRSSSHFMVNAGVCALDWNYTWN